MYVIMKIPALGMLMAAAALTQIPAGARSQGWNRAAPLPLSARMNEATSGSVALAKLTLARATGDAENDFADLLKGNRP